jgi:signal peptidase II
MAGTGFPERGRSIRAALRLFLVLGLFGCDHATKIATKASLEGSAAVPIAPDMLRGAVELRYVQNDDVAFSALHMLGVPRSPAMLIGLAVLAIAALAVMVLMAMRRGGARAGPGMDGDGARETPFDHGTQVGLALILGGALGNLVDRIARGYVVDFIHVKGWPVFNVADIAVVAGVMLIALARFVRRRRAIAPS